MIVSTSAEPTAPILRFRLPAFHHHQLLPAPSAAGEHAESRSFSSSAGTGAQVIPLPSSVCGTSESKPGTSGRGDSTILSCGRRRSGWRSCVICTAILSGTDWCSIRSRGSEQLPPLCMRAGWPRFVVSMQHLEKGCPRLRGFRSLGTTNLCTMFIHHSQAATCVAG